MDSHYVVGNNNVANIQSAPLEPGYKEYFKYTLGNAFFDPAARNMGKQNLKLKWVGDEAKKPDIARCFEINIK